MEFENVIDSEVEEEEYLLAQIEQELRSIYLSVEKLHNNASISETNDPIENSLIRDFCFSTCLVQRSVNDGLERNEDIFQSFGESLETEMNCLKVDLETLTEKINEFKEHLDCLEENASTIIQGVEELEPVQEQFDDVFLKNIKKRFRKEKSDLKSIVSSLFPENLEIQDIIARVVEHFLTEGSDKYLQLENTDNISEQIELLRRTVLFETNPFDPLQIRLVDLV